MRMLDEVCSQLMDCFRLFKPCLVIKYVDMVVYLVDQRY